MTYDQTVAAIKKVFDDGVHSAVTSTVEDASRDFYWKTQGKLNGDFLRVRYNPDGTGQLTVKEADRGSNFNRVEIDVEVVSAEQCYKYQSHVHGPETGSVFKTYFVYILENDEHKTISIYKVRGDEDKRVFVEIEARTQAEVEALERKIRAEVPIDYEPRNLYQIFIEGKK